MHSRLCRTLYLFVCLIVPTFALASSRAGDDCHAEFSAYLAAQPYIINAASADRRETTIIAILEEAGGRFYGAVPYRLEITSVATGRIVVSRRDGGDLPLGSPMERLFRWNGTDRHGVRVEDGEYEIRLRAQLLPGARFNSLDTEDSHQGERFEASGSPVRVVVDHAGRYDRLFERTTMPMTPAAGSIDSSFPYNFFYGSTHAHTSWSDGGMPVTDCQSGRYGYAGGSAPADAFSYAKTTGQLDYLAVVEHNHLMAEACSGCSNQQVLDRYAAGFQAAQTATVPGSFVALFGMEWGVISNAGHINLYNQSQLISWTGEPANVLVTKSNYPELYTAMRNNQGAYGSYGSFCHPNSADFGNWQRTADGDAVVRGLAILSGPAFSTSTSFAPGGTTYVPRYNQALSLGWKVAPEAQQDNHCWNYGNSTPNRTVAIVPNATTYTQQSLMGAYAARRVFAAEDRNVQLVYRTTDGTRVMGESFTAAAGVAVTVGVNDPDGEGVQKIEIWGGRAGTNASPGAAAAIQTSNTASTTLSATLSPKTAGEEWYYYVIAVQADGSNVWSAPMWVTWSSSCTVPATPALSSPAAGATNVPTTTSLSWSAASGATSYDIYLGAGTPAFNQNTAGTAASVSGLASGTSYSWYVIARNACGASPASATRSFTTASAGPVVTPIGCGATLSGSLATTDSRSTVRTTSYADVFSFSGTSGTSYTITLNSTAFDAWLVLKNPSGTVVAQDDDANGGTNAKIVYTATVTGTFTIEATSYAANATGAYSIALVCGGGGPVTLLNEGAESGAPGWTFVKNTGSGWSIESSTGSHSGSYRFRTNVAFSTYINSADWSIVSPAFSLAGKTSATLKYWFRHKTESGYDFFKVEISTNGGLTWTQLSSVSGQSSGWTGWAPQATISLNAYAGQSNCKIRFRMTSDGSVTDAGVSVDDITVTAQ